MQIDFNQGFTVYRNGKEPVYVTPHSGPAFELPTTRDDNSETVASLCWMKTGGTLIVSNTTRKRAMGIDFNRDIPPVEDALRNWQDFINNQNPEKLYQYRKKYAWVARDYEDYENRLKIYENFWQEIKTKDFIVFIHRAFPRLKAVPSLMDLVAINLDKNILNEIVEEINAKHLGFFKKIEKEYKAIILLEEERIITNIIRVYKKFGLDKMDIEFLNHLKKDLKAINKYAGKDVIKKLKENFTPNNFLVATKKALKKAEHPRITVEEIFKGTKSLGPQKQLSPENKIILQFEPTSFLNFRYPHKASEIITEIMDKVRELNSKINLQVF
jgi:hypothetical protein